MEIFEISIGEYLKRSIWTVLLLVFLTEIPAQAAAVIAGNTQGKAGSEVQLPLSFDKIDNVAGIKIILSYDKDLLEYVKAEKTDNSQGMMHIVNSSMPGQIILVMAGATGFGGEGIVFCKLYFRVKQMQHAASQTQIQILKAEAKSDKLVSIQLELKNGAVIFEK